MRILVTGATANVGRLVVDALLATGAPDLTIRALTNNPEKAALPPGVEVAEGYIGRPASLPPALAGVDRLYLAPLPRTVREVVHLAVRSGVRRIVDLSGSTADQEAQGDPSTWWYHAIERAVEAAPNVEWTHLRPGEFMTNMLDWAESIRTRGVVRAAYPTAAYAPIDLRDIADVTAKVLLEDGHHGATYELTGPETLSKLDRVRIIGEVLGREIRFEELSHAEARAEMLARGYGDAADWLLDGDAEAVGHPQQPVATVAALLGRPARTFRAWVEDNAAAFR